MFKFPDPLTEKALRDLMRDERYLKTTHPQHEAYRNKIKDGFDKLYGAAKARYDATGRMINDDLADSE